MIFFAMFTQKLRNIKSNHKFERKQKNSDLSTACQARFSLNTGVLCRPDITAFSEEKFFSRRHS